MPTDIDFFCKTVEDQTPLEIQYCEDFYEKQDGEEISDLVICICLVVIIIVFAVLLTRRGN